MKKILNYCKENMLFYTLLYFVLFIMSTIILNIFGMKYLNFVYIFSFCLVLIGIILSFIQINIKNKSKIVKICIKILGICAIIVCSLIIRTILIIFSIIPPEHIVERDNKKYIAHVYSFLDTRVEYYDYINFFVMGNTKKIEEYYNDIGRDVLDEDFKDLFSPTYIKYYDEKGNYQYAEENNNYDGNNEIENEDTEENYETIYTSAQLIKYEKDFNTYGINGFIISTNTYTTPSEIDLNQVFYNGAGFNNEISDEELEEYKKLEEYHGTDIVKVTTEQAENLYYENTGEKLENLKERLKDWIYIAKYDAYYKEVSDTNFEVVSCVEGRMNEKNNTMKIKLSNDRTILVKIDYEKGTHYIVSNT